jgi:hypothetical protein
MINSIRFFSFLGIMALLFCMLVAATFTSKSQINYFIENTSHIFLSGTSNVMDYSCDCDELVQAGEVFFIEQLSENKATFKNAIVKLKTKSFDCGNSLITGEMHSALQAKKHAYISIELKEIEIPNPATFLVKKNQWYLANGKADITIAGKTRRVDLVIKQQRISENEFRFGGTKSLKMTDFDIDPPTPAMGLIQVANEVEIKLDLKAKKIK